LFGHHFAAIAGAGPLIARLLAAQFGYLPGFLWPAASLGAGRAVSTTSSSSTASVRSNGRSLANIGREQ